MGQTEVNNQIKEGSRIVSELCKALKCKFEEHTSLRVYTQRDHSNQITTALILEVLKRLNSFTLIGYEMEIYYFSDSGITFEFNVFEK
jgi:hypothetical protein